MNCSDSRQHLSAYFDNELPAELRAEVADHVQSCADCTAALARIRSLSALARELPDPAAGELWQGIERELHGTSVSGTSPIERAPVRWRWPHVLLAVAASLLIGFFAWPVLHSHNAHDQMGINLSRYIEQFRTDPGNAEHFLRQQYAARSIEPADAIRLVNYKPIAPETLSDGVIRTETYLYEMPCCKCIQTLYRRRDGGSIAVFEHVDEEPAWFGERPTIHANCGNQDCCLVECDGQMAVTWKQGQRHITLVGAKDVDEVSRFVPAFADPTS